MGSLADAYDRYGARLYGYLLTVLRDAASAEDILQEVFCKLAARGAFFGIANPEHYLFRAAHNEARRWLKRNRRAEPAPTREPAAPQSNPLGQEHQEREAIRKALAALPPEQAEVIHLKVYEDMTFAEIGRMLGRSVNTVASRYRYACEGLRRMLGGLSNER